MTLQEFIDDLLNELKENPKWKNKKLIFNTSRRFGLEYLSIYQDDSGNINIDIGELGE
jgi:uncharacterized FlaG/YvyC family protein